MKATPEYVDKRTASVSRDSKADDAREPTIIDLSGADSNSSGDVHIEGLDAAAHAKPRAARSTDLVRLYLQEIGRVSLLERDEEVAEAQRVQQHMELLSLRDKAAEETGGTLAVYVNLMNTRDQLTAQLGHKPSLERWAKTAEIPVSELKPTLIQGKGLWAELASLSVNDLVEMQSEGVRAKEHMIKANLRLVVSVAKKYQNRGLELLDLIQEGTLGLERAVEKFDPTKGYRFSTYAYWWIRQGITRAIAQQARTIRIPIHVTEKLNKIKRTQRELSQSLGRTPTLAEVARQLEISLEDIKESLAIARRPLSLEMRVGDDQSSELGDLLEDDTHASLEEDITQQHLKQDLLNLLASLPPAQRDVITLRFGLIDGHELTLAQVGDRLGVSRERVRQIQQSALKSLRLRKNGVNGYLDS